MLILMKGYLTMSKNIRLLAQYYDISTNEVIEEVIIEDKVVLKAEVLRDLGYDHKNQVDYLQRIQDFKLKYQLKLSPPTECPKGVSINNFPITTTF